MPRSSLLPDPHTGLLPSDVQLIKETWLVLEQKAGSLGVAILVHLFDANPQYKSKFARFQHLSTEQLTEDTSFEAHACYIIHMLAALVHSLDDHLALGHLCKDVAEQHTKMDVPAEAFWELKDAIMSVVGTKIGDQVPLRTGPTWNKALDIIFEEITSNLAQ